MLSKFLSSLNEEGILAFKRYKIKRLKGNWKGYYRLRLGDIRIVFLIDYNRKEILIYDIGFRKNIYR